MSKEDIKYINPKHFYKVFQEISDHLHDTVFEKTDKELFYDRGKFIRRNTDWSIYKSKDEFEKDLVYHGDIESISIYIAQLVIFGRIIKERWDSEFNLSNGEVPLYLKQVNETPSGKNRDLYDMATGQVIKKWAKKNKRKIEESLHKRRKGNVSKRK